MDKLLEIKDLSVRLLTAYGVARGVRGVSLEIGEGEIVGIVGESGCGKTLTAKSVLGLHNPERAEVGGSILFRLKSGETVDIAKLKQKELQKIRGKEISMVLQDSSTALSPIITVGRQMEDVILAHRDIKRPEAREIAAGLLESVGISEPRMRLKCLPGELSGGQLQRVCIAMAMSSEPRLLLCDEPTTALDSVTQAQILELLKKLSKERNMAVLIVTHNFSVVKRICDRVYVMYAGLIAESGTAEEVTKEPKHRYTADLLKSIPTAEKKDRLESVAGSLPDVYGDITGCPYAPRCKSACEGCLKGVPMTEFSPTHFAACIKGGDFGG